MLMAFYLKQLFGTTGEIYQFVLNLVVIFLVVCFHDAVSTAAGTSSYLGKKLPE